jgi:TFIIF-interacting CTD phosphatase-like protein
LAINKKDLIKIFDDKLDVILIQNTIRSYLGKDPILSRLSQLQKEKIILEFKRFDLRKNQPVLFKNLKCDKIVIIIDGGLKYVREITIF